jgi:hypothetical protein
VHIEFRGGGTVLPYRGPYDRELLFEHVSQSVRRYGHIRVHHGNQHWMVGIAHGQAAPCDSCRQPTGNIVYVSDNRTFCHPCARRGL